MEKKGKRILRALLPPLVITLAVIAVYSTSIDNGFTNWDDNWLITENPWIREVSPRTIATILDPTVDSPIRFQLGGEYLPVRDFSYMLDFALYGLDPAGYHATNLILHWLVCLLLYVLVLRLSKSLPFAFAAGLLFAVHPLHVESVAWLSSRKDLLAAVFYLLALVAWNAHRGARKAPGRWMFYAACFPLYALAVTSKYMAVTLPAAFLLHDWLLFRPRPEGWKRRILFPLLLTTPFFAFMLFFAKTVVVRIASRGLIREWYGGGFFDTLYTVFKVMVSYVGSIFVPARLQACVDFPVTRSLDPAAAASGLLLAAGIGFGAWILYRALFRRDPGESLRLCAFSALFFIAAISPVSNVLFPMGTLYAERYLYLPLVGGPLIIAALFAASVRRAFDAGIPRAAMHRAVAAVLGLGLVAGAWGGKTLFYNRVWRDSETLWKDVLDKSGGDHHTAHFNLGIDATQRASKAGASAAGPLLAEAEDQLRRALVTRHDSYFFDYSRVHAALGTVLDLAGKSVEAVKEFDRALEINRENARKAPTELMREGERIARAEILLNRGNSMAKRDDLESQEEALRNFEDALELNPLSPLAHLNLGLLLSRGVGEGGTLKGKGHIERAMELDPYLAEAPLNLGILAFNNGDFDEARSYFEEALARAPRSPDAHFYLAAIHLESKEFEKAREEYGRIAEDPGVPVEWKVRARTHVALSFRLEGKYNRAEETYRSILAELPGAPEALRREVRAGLVDLYGTYGGLRLQQEKLADACNWFEKAYELDARHPGIAAGLAQACMKYGNDMATRAVALDLEGDRQAAIFLYRRALGAFRRSTDVAPSFENWLAVGETAKKVADLDTVLEAFAKARSFLDLPRLREDMMKIRIARAQALIKDGKESEALDECRRASGDDPSSPDPLRIMVHIYEKRARAHEDKAEEAEKKEDEEARKREKTAQRAWVQKALETVEAILELRPDSAPDLSQKGRLLAQLGRREEAVKAFKALIEREPKVAEHYVNLALLLERLGKGEEAIPVLRRGLAVNPDSTRAFESLLHSLKREGLRALAAWRGLMTKADDLDPVENKERYEDLFSSAMQKARDGEAYLEEYMARLAPGVKDDLTETMARRAKVDRLCLEASHDLEADPSGSESKLREALAMDPRHGPSVLALAKALEMGGKMEEAWREARRYLEIEGGASASKTFSSWIEFLARSASERRFEAGLSKMNAGDFKEALSDFDEALRLVPRFPKYVLGRGRVLEALERNEDALAAYREAASLLAAEKPGNESVLTMRAGLQVQAHTGAASLLTKARRWAEAAEEYAYARSAAPEDPFLALYHAEALEQAGSKPEARKAYEEALAGLEAIETGDDAALARKGFAVKKVREGLARLE